VRVVRERRGEHPWLWDAVESIPPKIGDVPQALLGSIQRPAPCKAKEVVKWATLVIKIKRPLPSASIACD
jgi:hypothetical protein